jgi:hypothetical protein
MAQVLDNTRLYRGQGQVFLAERDAAGKPKGFEFVGNVKELMLQPKTEKIEHTESQTGNNSIDKVIERALNVELSMTIDSIASKNLARLVFGKVTNEAVATITSEDVTGYIGKGWGLSRINLTSFTSLTNAAATTTYVAGTDYNVDLASGFIEFLSTATFTEGAALKANYAAGKSEIVSAFANPNKEYWLRVNGLNGAEENAPVIIDVFKARFAPADDVPIINDDNFAEYKQSGTGLFDGLRSATDKFGRYFSVRQLSLT